MNVIRPVPLTVSLLALGLVAAHLPAADLRVPAFTAYTLPDVNGARVSQRSGVTRWTDPATSVNWYGEFKHPGELTAKIALRLPPDAESKLKLTIAGQSHEVTVKAGADNQPVTADFGTFNLVKTH
jgi:hypothetical protein